MMTVRNKQNVILISIGLAFIVTVVAYDSRDRHVEAVVVGVHDMETAKQMREISLRVDAIAARFKNNLAVGLAAAALHTNSIAIGAGATTTSDNQLMLRFKDGSTFTRELPIGFVSYALGAR